MATVQDLPAPSWSLPRLRRHFGNIPVERLVLRPRPGAATEDDLLKVNEHDGLCELIDGCLVEKAMGAIESLLASVLGFHFQLYLNQHLSGIVLGADGMLRLRPGLVLVPDVSVMLWDSMGVDEFPEQSIPDLYPDLAVEVISKGNTRKEMERKLTEYFASGATMVWLVYPKKRTIEVYRSPQDQVVYKNGDVLKLVDVLPGFKLSLSELFASRRRRRSKP